jgi:hypothetical protein
MSSITAIPGAARCAFVFEEANDVEDTFMW